ncbi:MAG: VTT domain-containing protein [bacterium]|nr:VTT domain-containing protein [bacterium]
MNDIKNFIKYIEPGAFYFALAAVFTIVTLVREPLGLPGVDTLANIATGFFERYGLMALYVAALIESLFMISFYFPGSLVVILAILVSDRSFLALTIIIAIGWASVMTATVINYWLGKEGFYRLLLYLGSEDGVHDMQKWLEKRGKWAIFLSAVHPNILAITNICMGIARAGLAKTLAFSFVAIAFWIPVQVYVLGFLLPDPKESAAFLQWIIVVGIFVLGVRAVRKKSAELV